MSVTLVSIKDVCAACPSLTTQFCEECAKFSVCFNAAGRKEKGCRIYAGVTERLERPLHVYFTVK